METVFGTRDLVMLTRQSQPFDVVEVWKIPDNRASSLSDERCVYRGCWFTNLGRTLSSEDNRIVNVSASLVFTQKVLVKSLANLAASFTSPFTGAA